MPYFLLAKSIRYFIFDLNHALSLHILMSHDCFWCIAKKPQPFISRSRLFL